MTRNKVNRTELIFFSMIMCRVGFFIFAFVHLFLFYFFLTLLPHPHLPHLNTTLTMGVKAVHTNSGIKSVLYFYSSLDIPVSQGQKGHLV